MYTLLLRSRIWNLFERSTQKDKGEPTEPLVSSTKRQPTYSTFLNLSQRAMEVDQPDRFFHVEYMDVDMPDRLMKSADDLSSEAQSSSEIESDTDGISSSDVAALMGNNPGMIEHAWELVESADMELDRAAAFRERGLHSDIFFNSTLGGMAYNKGKSVPKGAQHLQTGPTANHLRKNDVLHSAYCPLRTVDCEATDCRCQRRQSVTAAQKREAELAAWFAPQPVNLERVKNTSFTTLEMNAWNRMLQNEQLNEISLFLLPPVEHRGMDDYYATKYGEDAASDPFVQGWLRAQKRRHSIPNELMAEVDRFVADKEDVSLEDTVMTILDMMDQETTQDVLEHLRSRQDFESEVREHTTLLKMVDEGTAQDDIKLLSGRREPPRQALEHARLGEASTENAPSLLFDPDNRASGESSKTQPIAALQSVRRRRYLPKLAKLDTSFLP